MTFPHEEMHEEAVNLKDRFVAHRDEDQGAYRHTKVGEVSVFTELAQKNKPL